MTTNSKLVLTAIGLATLVASPAFAQKHRAHYSDAYASAAIAPQANTVVSGDRVIGADPDPQIRSELERDAPTYTSGN